ncbi:LysR family transcriptional regulator [Chelativorans intermedius]|uniref:LysR family transcriptional regulator n=1 Tax=Chelativorans intermedius TaxID=515947 RepID=A0ABV6D968_9HYPH|nr:LysR family transcriptional regulator [Chelativorans intermedius]MCT8998697.1 LysR family transcriptional regulator [Chelativorans intermedius]
MPAHSRTPLKLAHFRLIAAIAEQGQLSPAAAALSMTQPAASRMLAQIEAIVGAPLFERHARGMEPTAVGHMLVRRAETLLTTLRQAVREVEDFKGGRSGQVRVGAVTGAAVGYVIPAIQKLKAAAPDAEVHIDVAPSDELVRDLLAGHFDFVLGRVPPPHDPADFIVARGREELVDLVVRRGHPLAGRKAVRLAELTGFEWIMQSRGAPVRLAVEQAFLEAGAALPRDVINTTSLLAMIAHLVTSDAIAPLSREVSDLLGGDDGRPALCVLALRETIVVSPYHLLTLRDRPLSPLAERLRMLVATELARQG